MVTKRELLEALSQIADDDEVIIALRTPEDDEEEKGFAETESAGGADDDESDNPGYVECEVDEIEVVDATDDSGKKALLLYTDIPDGNDDMIFVDEDGHYVDLDDNYVTKDGEPTDTPVKADPEDLED